MLLLLLLLIVVVLLGLKLVRLSMCICTSDGNQTEFQANVESVTDNEIRVRTVFGTSVSNLTFTVHTGVVLPNLAQVKWCSLVVCVVCGSAVESAVRWCVERASCVVCIVSNKTKNYSKLPKKITCSHTTT